MRLLGILIFNFSTFLFFIVILMFVYIDNDELLSVFGLLICLIPLPVSLAGKKLSKCRHLSTFSLFPLLYSTFNMCLNKRLEPRVQSPCCLWSSINASASQGSNPARTSSPWFRFLVVVFFQQKIIKRQIKKQLDFCHCTSRV